MKRALTLVILFLTASIAGFYGSEFSLNAQTQQQKLVPDLAVCESGSDKDLCYDMGNAKFSWSQSMAEKEEGIPFFERACELGHGNACSVVGRAVGMGSINRTLRENYVVDLVRGREFFAKGCKLDGATACTLLGRFQIRGIAGPLDRAGALKSFDRGCLLDGYPSTGHYAQAEACYQLGMAAAQATGKAVVPQLAARYFDKGCSVMDFSGDKYDSLSCLEGGRAFELGLYGQFLSLEAAVNRYKDGCYKGSEASCVEWRRMLAGEGGRIAAASQAASTAAFEAKAKPDCDAIGIKAQSLINAHDVRTTVIVTEGEAMLQQGDRTAESAKIVTETFRARFDTEYENFCHEILNLRDQANLSCVNTYRENMMSSLKDVAQKATAGISGTGGNCRMRLKY